MRVAYRRRKLGGMLVANRGWHGSVTLADTSERDLEPPKRANSGVLSVVSRGRQTFVSY